MTTPDEAALAVRDAHEKYSQAAARVVGARTELEQSRLGLLRAESDLRMAQHLSIECPACGAARGDQCRLEDMPDAGVLHTVRIRAALG